MPFSRKLRVAVAMSGGVDSTVSAALLLEQGYDVMGITMRLMPDSPEHPSTIEAARRAADQLCIAHYVWDAVEPFEKEVVSYFVGEYSKGRTPNPCVRCNQRVKFGGLLAFARDRGAEYLATGHYARVVQHGERLALRRGVWRPKDQSYALAGLTQEQLRHVLFPLGQLSKDETRMRARNLGLTNAEKTESQEICFIPGDDYGAFLSDRVGPAVPGPILSVQGKVLGQHKGLMFYTVGQRKGLGIAAERPYYVIKIDAATNSLIVGHDEETFRNGLQTGPVNWGAIPPQTAPFACLAQIRYLHRPVPAVATPVGEGLEVRFETPQRAVTPGQWAVLYDDAERVLAAGIIE